MVDERERPPSDSTGCCSRTSQNPVKTHLQRRNGHVVGRGDRHVEVDQVALVQRQQHPAMTAHTSGFTA